MKQNPAPPPTHRCAECGAFNPVSYSFCGACGVPFTKPEVESETESSLRESLKKCPYCAELIQAGAIKCRYCGEFLTPPSAPPKATFVTLNSRSNALYLDTDGSKGFLVDLITSAIRDSGGYILINIDREAGLIKFETAGMTWQSAAGEEITASVAPTDFGASAMFIARAKPFGMLRVAAGRNPRKHVEKLLRYVR